LQNAKTFCGTSLYLAPELYNGQPQTPKMDIWSLFVTIAVIAPEYNLPPKDLTNPGDIIKALRTAAATGIPQLQPMAWVNPNPRASAARMLKTLYDGRGLTTPVKQVPSNRTSRSQQLCPSSRKPHLGRHLRLSSSTLSALINNCRDLHCRQASSGTASRRGRWCSSLYAPTGTASRNSQQCRSGRRRGSNRQRE
jgi:serine/threonine protein kinase